MGKKSSVGCDGLSCFLGCLSLVPGFRKNLVSRIAFFPPSPPGYILADTGNADSSVVFLYRQRTTNPWKYTIEALPRHDVSIYGTINITHVAIPTREGIPIHAFHLTRADATHTIIFSHGNSTDIGLMFPQLLNLAKLLYVNVIAYDFWGYGASDGIPSETGLYSNISAVFEYLTGPEHRISPSRIILYGQSVGSAPSIDLASRVDGLAGVIIHSGMKSGFTVLHSNCDSIPWFDAFKNLDKIKSLKCPIFILHGTEDTDIKIEHGRALYNASRNAYCWWAEGAGHNDIEVVFRKEYFTKLHEFLFLIGALHHERDYYYRQIKSNGGGAYLSTTDYEGDTISEVDSDNSVYSPFKY